MLNGSPMQKKSFYADQTHMMYLDCNRCEQEYLDEAADRLQRNEVDHDFESRRSVQWIYQVHPRTNNTDRRIEQEHSFHSIDREGDGQSYEDWTLDTIPQHRLSMSKQMNSES